MRQQVDILYVGFLLGHAGDALQMLSLAAGMQRRGASVQIVVPELPTSVAFAALCEERGVPCLRSGCVRADMHRNRQYLLALLRLFRRFRASVTHLHTGDVCPPRLATVAMDLAHVPPAVATVQSPYATLLPGSRRARSWARAVARRYRAVVCPSEHARAHQLAAGVPADRVRVIRNSVDTKRFGSGDRALIRDRLGMPEDARVVLFTSRLDAQKRPLDAVRAFAAAAKGRPGTYLVFAGSGSEREAILREASALGQAERVRCVGYQTDIQNWLAAADVWILPTEAENFSLALLEAMAAGCPVLTTLCAGNDEVVEHERNALVVPVGDVEALADGLTRLLDDPEMRSRLARGAKETAARYDEEAMVTAYAACYSESCGAPSGTGSDSG